MTRITDCELCRAAGADLTPAWQVIVRRDALRVVRVLDAPGHPAFYRVVWNDHVAEMSDLDEPARRHCLDAVMRVEQALRRALAPTKINLASLGNLVPHLHWHVIARFDWDRHFPQPVWGSPQRLDDEARLGALAARLPAVDRAVADLFA